MSTLRGHLSTLLAFLVLSTLWTWPAANLIDPVLPTRHFDLLPTIWLIDVAPEVLPGLVHPDSVYPAGEHLVHGRGAGQPAACVPPNAVHGPQHRRRPAPHRSDHAGSRAHPAR